MSVTDPPNSLGPPNSPGRLSAAPAMDRAMVRHAGAGARKSGNPVVVGLLISLVIPIILPLGPINLSAYKVALLLILLPVVAIWLSGKAGPVKGADLVFLFFCVWVAMTYVIMHTPSKVVEPVAVLFMETFIAYLAGRVFVRNKEDFLHFCRWFCGIIGFLAVFAAIEAIGKVNLISEIPAKIFTVAHVDLMAERWGMHRAFSGFEHSILFGVFCSMGFSLAFLVLGYRGDGVKRSRLWTLFVTMATFFSLSVGAFLSIIAQFGLYMWGRIMRWMPGRWWVLFLGLSSVWIFLSLASNRGPMGLFFSYFTFNPQAAYIRLDIWNYGIQNVIDNPIMGMGLNAWNWQRPGWLPVSTDHMWLTLGMRHGFVGLGFLVLGYLLVMIGLMRARIIDGHVNAMRIAGVTTMVAITIATCTVHLWAAPYVMLNFFIGTLVWITDVNEVPQENPAEDGTAGAAEPDRPARRSARSGDPDGPGYSRSRTAPAGGPVHELPTSRRAVSARRRAATPTARKSPNPPPPRRPS